jgi:glycosyltransferase involved in cell wall biosynthesis
MASILINGISARSGGGKSILVNFIKLLHQSTRREQYVVIVPGDSDYSQYAKENIEIIPAYNSTYNLYTFYFKSIRQIVKEKAVSLILNIADVVAPVHVNQVYLFDWPYATYPESVVWKRMSAKEWLFKKFKLFLIRRYIKLPVLILAQTKVSAIRLRKAFSVTNTEVVPNAVSLDHFTGGQPKDFALPKDRFKLLYLTKYYSHKNIEIFIPVARLIRENKLPYCIVTTIHESQHINAKKFLRKIATERLDDIIINVGPVDMGNVPSLYQQTDALLMPTLLESFSGTYVEAMYHGKPIFTSEIDFARDICGDAAFYFDPLDENSILSTIKSVHENDKVLLDKIELGHKRLSGFPTWQDVFEKLIGIIEKHNT